MDSYQQQLEDQERSASHKISSRNSNTVTGTRYATRIVESVSALQGWRQCRERVLWHNNHVGTIVCTVDNAILKVTAIMAIVYAKQLSSAGKQQLTTAIIYVFRTPLIELIIQHLEQEGKIMALKAHGSLHSIRSRTQWC